MFELSFGEILLVTTVALIVLGPERLPAVARFLGRMVAKVQHLVNNVKAEITAEVGLNEFKQVRDELQSSAEDFRQDLNREAEQLRQTEREIRQEVDALPYWERLPAQRTPADFGITGEADAAFEGAWVAQQQRRHDGASSLAQQSRSRRKARAYSHINRPAVRLGARRQRKSN